MPARFHFGPDRRFMLDEHKASLIAERCRRVDGFALDHQATLVLVRESLHE
jgi:hypothetical protein